MCTDASTLLEFELRELLGLNTGSISGQLIDADTKQPLAEVTMFASRLATTVSTWANYTLLRQMPLDGL